MSKLKLGLYAVLILLLGALAGRLTAPKKLEIKTIEVEKIVEKEKRVIEQRIVYKSDGSKVVESGIVEDLQRTEDRVVKTQKIEDLSLNLGISLIAKTPTNRLGSEMSYGLLVEKAVLGSIFLGIYADTERQVGLSVGIKF